MVKTYPFYFQKICYRSWINFRARIATISSPLEVIFEPSQAVPTSSIPFHRVLTTDPQLHSIQCGDPQYLSRISALSVVSRKIVGVMFGNIFGKIFGGVTIV